MPNEAIAKAVLDLIAVNREQDTRAAKGLYATTVAQRKSITAALKAIGGADVGILITRAVTPPNSPTDTLAPATPSGVGAQAGTGVVTFVCDPTADLPLIAAATGIASYIVNVNGVDQTPVPVNGSTIFANALIAPVLVQIGAYSPTPTLAQSGRNFTLTSAGTGIDGSSDQLAMAAWEVTGDFDLYCNLDLFSGAGLSYAPAGLMWRETTLATASVTPGCRFGAIYRWLTNGSSGIEDKDRITPSTASHPNHNVAGTNSARQLRIRKRRTGAVDTISYSWSADGTAWNVLDSIDYTGMSNTLVIGGFVCDLQATPVVLTARCADLRYTPGAQTQISKSYATGTTASGYWRAVDAVGQSSPVSPTVSASGATLQAIGWHPGHGIGAGITNSSNTEAQVKGIFDLIRFEPNFKFCHLILTWRELEPSPGVYNYTKIDLYLDYVSNVTTPGRFAVAKYFTLEIFHMVFPLTQSVSVGTQAMPQNVIDNGWYGTGPTQTNIADLRITACRNQYIALHAALAVRYNNDPRFEAIVMTETANQYDSGLLTMAAAVKAQWTKTNVIVLHNYTFDPTSFSNQLVTMRVGAGGPDIKNPPLGETDGQKAFRGALGGAVDGRGITPNMLENEVKEFQAPADLINYCAGQQVTHCVWWPEFGLSPSYQNWDTAGTGVRDSVNANPNSLHLTYPTGY